VLEGNALVDRGAGFGELEAAMIMRATQKKMMSAPVARVVVG
jgi:hypothetical protein